MKGGDTFEINDGRIRVETFNLDHSGSLLTLLCDLIVITTTTTTNQPNNNNSSNNWLWFFRVEDETEIGSRRFDWQTDCRKEKSRWECERTDVKETVCIPWRYDAYDFRKHTKQNPSISSNKKFCFSILEIIYLLFTHYIGCYCWMFVYWWWTYRSFNRKSKLFLK